MLRARPASLAVALSDMFRELAGELRSYNTDIVLDTKYWVSAAVFAAVVREDGKVREVEIVTKDGLRLRIYRKRVDKVEMIDYVIDSLHSCGE